MAKHAPVIYKSVADLKAAIEAVDTTTTVQIIPFIENGKQKFMIVN